MRRTYTNTTDRERLVRAVLAASPDIPHASLAQRLDMDRESVRRVRRGLLWADLAPELPRLDSQQMTRTCRTCRLFDHAPYRRKENGSDSRYYGHCSLGYPEAIHNHHWARSCEAYAHDPTING